MGWPIEEIPDNNVLFRRIRRQHYRNNKVSPSAFENLGKGMSTNWKKYATARQSKQMDSKDPQGCGIVSLLVSDIKKINLQDVEHTPKQRENTNSPDRSHTDVIGSKDLKTQIQFTRIYRMKIEPLQNEM